MLDIIKSKIQALQCLWVGLGITLIQIFTLLLFSPQTASFHARFLSLNNWDSWHYSDLVNKGYHMPPLNLPIVPDDVHQFRANLGYFPAYHLTAKAFKDALGISTEMALLLSAQFFSVIFWVYLFLLMKKSKVSTQKIMAVLFLVAIYPSSFYLVIGYSESIFMASLVGFIYWSNQWLKNKSKLSWGIAALHGFAMASTRIVGIPVVFYPVIQSLATQWSTKLGKDKKQFHLNQLDPAALAISIIALLGPFLFFLFCQIKFLDWRWYFKLQKIGWGKDPNYLAILDPHPTFHDFSLNIRSRLLIGPQYLLLLGFFGKRYVPTRLIDLTHELGSTLQP